MVLEPWEFQAGSYVRISRAGRVLNDFPIRQFFTSSSLTHALELTTDPGDFTSSGNYDVTMGIYGANDVPIGYEGNVNDPDVGMKTVYLNCGLGASSTTTTATTTPLYYPGTTSTPSSSSGYFSTVTPGAGYYTTTYAIPCAGSSTMVTTTLQNGVYPSLTAQKCSYDIVQEQKQKKRATIGGAVGGALGGLLLIAIGVFFLLRRRRNRTQTHDSFYGAGYPPTASDPEKESYDNANVQPVSALAFEPEDANSQPYGGQSSVSSPNHQQQQPQQQYGGWSTS